MSRGERRGARLVQAALLCVLLALWYAGTLPGRISPLLLPPPGPVFADFVALVAGGSVWPDLLITLGEWLASFALAAAAGLAIGYAVSRTPFTVRVFDPLFASLYSVPAIVLFPLYLLFFGLGSGSKIALGATVAFFPIVLNTIAGLGYVDRAYLRAARSMGADARQLFWSVMLPAAFPVVLTGLRLGCIIAFLTILGGETISALGGIGHRIVGLAENMESAQMFANIVFAVLLAVAINAVLSAVEERGKRWSP